MRLGHWSDFSYEIYVTLYSQIHLNSCLLLASCSWQLAKYILLSQLTVSLPYLSDVVVFMCSARVV